MPYEARNADVNEAIREVIDELDVEDPELRSYVRQIMVTGGKLSRDDAGSLEMKLITNSLKEIRYAFQVFQKYEDRDKISVFGSARSKPEDPVYQSAETFASMAADEGYMLISGAGPGIMEAVNKGAGSEASFGLHITLPFEDLPNRYIRGDEKCIHFRYFFSRKLLFAKEADAVVIYPGGFGTHDELLELLTLMQTGRQHLIPLVLIDVDGFWDRFLSYMRENLISTGRISETDLNLFEYVSTPREAVEFVNTFYSNYHSSRYVGEEFVVRFRDPPSTGEQIELESSFGDLCPESGFRIQREPVEGEESGVPDDLYRLIFTFTLKDYGRLRKMIDFLNSWSDSPNRDDGAFPEDGESAAR